MSDLKITDISFSKEHDTPDMILKKTDKTDSRQYTDVFVKCKEKGTITSSGIFERKGN